MRLSREEMEQKSKELLLEIRKLKDKEAVPILADAFQKLAMDALMQAGSFVQKLHRRYGNDTVERMTDDTSRMISECGRKIGELWEEASGINAYDGTPIKK